MKRQRTYKTIKIVRTILEKKKKKPRILYFMWKCVKNNRVSTGGIDGDRATRLDKKKKCSKCTPVIV